VKAVAIVEAFCVFLATATVLGQQRSGPSSADNYLTWTSAQAQRIGRGARVNGRVGSAFDFRVVHTERSYNYKLRATWLTPEVIRASARLTQLTDGLSNDQTQALVAEAEAVADTVLMVEIDPREGSGVVPLDWTASLGPRGSQPGEPASINRKNVPGLRQVRGLRGVFRRDYTYEVFWLVFPLSHESGDPLFAQGVSEAELVVRIYDKEGRVKWAVPDSIRGRQPVR